MPDQIKMELTTDEQRIAQLRESVYIVKGRLLDELLPSLVEELKRARTLTDHYALCAYLSRKLGFIRGDLDLTIECTRANQRMIPKPPPEIEQ
jgi:hypothetical protein